MTYPQLQDDKPSWITMLDGSIFQSTRERLGKPTENFRASTTRDRLSLPPRSGRSLLRTPNPRRNLRWSPSPPNLTRDRLVVQQRGGYAQNIAKHHAAGCFVERDSLLNDDNRGDIGQLEKNHQPTGFWRLHISENNSMQWWVVGVWS